MATLSDDEIVHWASAHLRSPGPTRSHLRSIAKVTSKPLREAVLDVDGTFRKIRAKYPNASGSKAKFQAIVNALAKCEALAKLPRATHALAKWRSAMNACSKIAEDGDDDNQATAEELEQMVPISHLEDAVRRCENHATRQLSQWSLLGAIAVYVWPKRANWSVRVARSSDEVREGENAVVLDRDGATLVLQDYKTSASYGRYEERLPRPLVAILRRSLKKYPRSHLFLQDSGGEPCTSKNMSDYMFSATEWLVQRRIGWNTLRHMWISQRIDFNRTTIAEQKEIARKMLHSWKEQTQYYRVGAQFRDPGPPPKPPCLRGP